MKPRFRTRRELSLSSTYRVPRARELRNHVRNSRATRARYLMSIDSLEAAWTTQRRGKRFRSTGRFAECARVTSRGRGRGGEAGIQMTATKRAVTFAGAGCHTHTHTHRERETRDRMSAGLLYPRQARLALRRCRVAGITGPSSIISLNAGDAG